MYNGPPIDHADDSAPDAAPNDGEYRAPTSYAPFPEKDGYDTDSRKYGAVESRAFDIEVSSPVDDVETLLHRTHLTAQFHEANRNYWEQETPYANNAGQLYDLAVLDLAEEKLSLENIDPSDLDMPERRLNALFLRQAREQCGEELYEHLAGPSPVQLAVHTSLGYDGPADLPSYDTFQREFRRLRDGDEIRMDAFEAAVTRTVYACYRAGIVPPDGVKTAYNFDAVEPPLNEKVVPRESEQEELRKFVNLLLDVTAEPLSFGRETGQTKHDMRAFIGAFAASAMTGAGLEKLKEVCDWNYPRERIPSGGWLHNYVSDGLAYAENLSEFHSDADGEAVPPIDEQFTAVHGRTLALANKLGFWSESDPLNIGADMFRIDWTGDSIDATIGRPPKADNEAVTEQWTFLIAGGIETERRFVLGARWIEALSDYPKALEAILSDSPDTVDIGTIFIDGEIVSGELIKTVRRFAGDDWVISAPDKAIVKGVKRLTPSNQAGFARDVKWNVHPKPNVITYPYDGDQPTTVEIDPDDVLTEAIRDEEAGEKIDVPLDTGVIEPTHVQQSIVSEETIPALPDAVADLESEPGIGDEFSHAAYLTDRSLPERSAGGVRFQYPQRWAIEPTVGQITNHFMPQINSEDYKQRLYGVHIAILFYNWHTLINRCVSPGGLRLDVSHQQLLQAIQDVAFGEARNDD